MKKIKNNMLLYISNASDLAKSDKNVVHYIVFNDKKEIIRKSKKYDFFEEKCIIADSKDKECIGRLLKDSRILDGKYYGKTIVINEENRSYYEIRTVSLTRNDKKYFFLLFGLNHRLKNK